MERVNWKPTVLRRWPHHACERCGKRVLYQVVSTNPDGKNRVVARAFSAVQAWKNAFIKLVAESVPKFVSGVRRKTSRENHELENHTAEIRDDKNE